MSAARGDANLAAAAQALTTSRFVDAHNLLEEARLEYMKAGVTDREELITAIRKRIDDALAVMCSPSDSKQTQSTASPSTGQAGSPGMELSQRLRLAKQKGDDLIAQASKALGNREFLKARSLAEKARASFQAAGSNVARERENIVGNLLSYIQVEEERAEANRRKKLKQQKQEEEVKKMAKRVEDALDASLALPNDEEQIDPEDGTNQLSAKPDICILVDNGSSRASSTKLLRSIAEKLSKKTGFSDVNTLFMANSLIRLVGTYVTPVSLAHADKTPVEELDGTPAKVFSTFLREEVRDREVKTILVLPLFLGPSKVFIRRSFHPETLQGCHEANSRHTPGGERRFARTSMITDDCISEVHAASMERFHDSKKRFRCSFHSRRPGPEYAFCDPLLIDCIPQDFATYVLFCYQERSLVQIVSSSLVQIVSSSLVQILSSSLVQILSSLLVQILSSSIVQIVSSSLVQILSSSLVQI
eukprot:766650-Hanusia_phi.AAC.1